MSNNPNKTFSQINGATKFALDGMILVLERHENTNILYYDCEYISAFDDEAECLFFGSDSILKIKTIKDIKNEWKDYLYYLQSIHCLLRLIKSIDYDDKLIHSKQFKKAMREMILNRIHNNAKYNVPKYISNLLQYHLINAPPTITINGITAVE